MKSQGHPWVRWLITAAKLGVFALLGWFIYAAIARDSERLAHHTWQVEPAWLVAAGGLYLLGMLPAAWYWQRVLAHAGQEVGFVGAIRAYYVSQLGKYVPGKLMVIVIRNSLVRSAATETTVVTASVFFETLSMLAVGSLVSAIVLLLWHRGQYLLIGTAIGSFFLLGVPTVPSVFGQLIHRLGVSKLNPTAAAKLSRMGPREVAIGWSTIGVGWLVQGMSLWAVLRAMGVAEGGPFRELSLHTTAVSLGVVAGFISQIPGGLVVREWVSGELLQAHYGESVALVSAILLRMVWLVSELAVSIILYIAGLRRVHVPEQTAADFADAGPQEAAA